MNSTTNAPTTIVLGDDHKVILRGLRAVLDAQPGLAVVGEASDGVLVLYNGVTRATRIAMHET